MEDRALNKSQSKYFNTACLMDEALLRLLEKKSFEYITVKELCKVAGVNRSTFYLHYESMEELLSECIEYLGNRISQQFARDEVLDRSRLASCSLEELLLLTPQYLIPYLEFVKENRRIFAAAISQPGTFRVQGISGYLYDTLFDPILARYGVPQEERTYKMAFYLSGVWAIIAKWVAADCKDEIPRMVRMILECTGLEPDGK